jgi:hypothetical protein
MKSLAAFNISVCLVAVFAVRAEALSCEQSFVAQSLQARWRSASREHYVIDQTDRLLQAEFKNHLPSEIYEAVRVEDYSLIRFDADRVSLLEVTASDRKKSVAQVRVYSAGRVGQSLQVLPFFEVIHREASATREWRRLSPVTMTQLGFSSNLASWKSLYYSASGQADGKQVFELSRLNGATDHAAVLSRELAKHQRANPGALYFAYAKSLDQAKLYENLLGLRVVETFENPRTGVVEFILSTGHYHDKGEVVSD